MTRVRSVIFLVLLFATTEKLGASEPLANADKRGLYVRSVEQALRLDEEEIDLATAALIISEEWSDLVHGRRYLQRLDSMAYEIRDIMEDKGIQADHKAIGVINEYLFDKLGFEATEEAANPDDLFLHTVLDEKRGYCLSLSALYLSLAERLGLPVYGVVVPGHFFVRYDSGRVRFNIETTSKGGYADDQHYINKFKVPQSSNDSIYLVNLTKIQTLGCFFNNLGDSYDKTGDSRQAISALEKAVEINPGLAEAHLNLGNLYLKTDRTADAIYEYQAALQINPKAAKTYNNLGNAYLRRGWVNDAISQYMQALSLEPDFIEVYSNLAAAYSKNQMFAKAESSLKEAIALEPKNSNLHNQLGNVYSQAGNYKQAISQYKTALKLKADIAEAHYGIAICYNKLGRFDDEIRAYKKALSIRPDMAAALANLGNAYFRQKKYDAAIEQYEKAASIEPDHGIYYNLGAAHYNKKHYERAVTEYLKAINIQPTMGDAHHGLAFAFYELKKYDLALEHIETAERLGVEIDKNLLAAIEAKL